MRDERRRLERAAGRGDRAAMRRLDDADSSLRWAKDVWKSDREWLPGQLRLLEELGRRGRLLASTISGYHHGVSVRLHDAEDSPPRGRGWRLVTITEFSRYEGKGLDMKSMGPKSALRRLLEGLRQRFGARSRLLELREEWERQGVSPESEWVSWAKARLREGPGRSGNPGRREDEERFARRAASGDPSAARRLEAARKVAEADRLPAAEREYLRHVGKILLVRTLLVSTEDWGMSEEIDLRRPVRACVLGRREYDDGTFLAPRIAEVEDGVVHADWPVALLDRVRREDFAWPNGAAEFIVVEQDDLFPRGSKGSLWVMADSDARRSWRRT